jgi:hypothetical protein
MPHVGKEREDLAKAERHIIEGELRVTEQICLIDDMARRGENTKTAEALLGTMKEMLNEWQAHRRLILQEIARIEGS